jgi:hypothetical protein
MAERRSWIPMEDGATTRTLALGEATAAPGGAAAPREPDRLELEAREGEELRWARSWRRRIPPGGSADLGRTKD